MWRAKPGDSSASRKISKTPVERDCVGRCRGQRRSHAGRTLASAISVHVRRTGSVQGLLRLKPDFYFCLSLLFSSSLPLFSPFQPFHGVKIRRRDPQSLPDAADCWLPDCLPDPAKLPHNSIPFVSPHKRCPFFSASCGWHVPTSSAHTYA